MDKPEAIDHVMTVVRQVQEDSLRPIAELTATVRPLEDIEGFDSVNCVETVCKLSEILNLEIPDSVFIPEKDAACPTFEQIADNLLRVVNERSMASV